MSIETDVLSAIDALEPEKRAGGLGRPASYTPEEVVVIYNARKRGVSWKQINDLLPKPLSRPGTLASSVHGSAKRHGIEPYITQRKSKD
jgi:hypothetical protein